MNTLSIALALASFPFQTQNPLRGADDKRVYYVATAHLDTNWLWTIQTTISDYIPKTLRVNFDYFKKYPDYVFNFEGAFRYMLMKEYYPEQYQQLKDYIAQGKWRVTGSWLCAVDTNIPSPESLIRQTLYGNGFWKKEFGKTSDDIFLPDCFGFGYALPSIAAHCGLIGFSTQKLSWGSAAGIPFPIGTWTGVDGSTIVAALDPGSYGNDVEHNAASNPDFIKQADALGAASGAYAVYRYHGTGDTGGGPSENSMENLSKQMAANGPLKVLSAPANQLYRDVTPQQVAKMPNYKGELLLTTHGTGCYTSQAEMKHLNRKNELLADSAERAATFADWLGEAKYPREKLADAWVHFLWHQFHDDLTGTSIPPVYPFSWNDEALSLNRFAAVLNNSATGIASKMDTRGEGTPVVVYNPLGFEREDLVTAPISDVSHDAYVTDPEGNAVASQYTGDNASVEFVAKAPANGWAVYHVGARERRATATCAALNPIRQERLKDHLRVTLTEMENQRYKVRIDDHGDIASIYDKALSRELLKSPIRLQMLDDYSPDWPSWEIKYQTVRNQPKAYVDGPANVTVADRGAARVALKIERSVGESKFVQIVSLTDGGQRVDVSNDVDWHRKGTLLKAAFHFNSQNPMATYDLGLGAISRGNDTDKKYEVPAQQWADLTAADGSYGAAVLSESKYGWDKPSDDVLRLTCLHTARGNGGYKFQETNDLGPHHFEFSIQGHKGDWRNGVVHEAASLNEPMVGYATASHNGKLGKSFSEFSCSDSQVAIKAVKKAEESDEIVIRVFESAGKAHHGVALNFPSNVLRVREVNGQENPMTGADVRASGKSIRFDVRAYQPRAFAVTLSKPAAYAAALKCEPIEIPYDANVVTKQGEKSDAGFDGKGDSIAAELFPESLTSEDVAFKLGPAASNNALIPFGQTLRLPNGARKVVFLAAAKTPDDQTLDFGAGNAFDMPCITGRIAQWTNRYVNGKVLWEQSEFQAPYMKYAPVAWIGTHRHNADGGNDLYIYTYMFRFTVDVPAGSDTITLPINTNTLIFAATAVYNARPDCRPTRLLYK